jgi:hypothetical protein
MAKGATTMSLTEADYLSALHGYIVAVTGLDGGVVFRGNQSRMVLPQNGAYCIYTPIIRQRRGTNCYDFNAVDYPDNKNGVDSMTALILIDVQVDFYAEGAAQNAQMLEIASRSYMGTNYFKAAGVDVRACTADNPRNLTGIDASNQYEERWTVTITTEINCGMTNELPWFEDFTFDGIKNVDVYFPPTE